MWFNRLQQQFSKRVDASSLATFRIVWGLLMVWEAVRKLPKVTGIYSPEYFHFSYWLFPFVQPLPEVWMMRVEVWVMIVAGVLMTAGLWFRASTAIFLLIYTHLFLIDQLYFNNHFYLTILILFLLMISDADACYRLRWPWSKRARVALATPATVPFWNLVLLRGQVIVLYFFGGIAKLNSDWLQGEPVRFWFNMKPPGHILSPLLHQEWFVWFVCWSGLLLDLAAGFTLLHRKTRVPTMILLIAFHLTNHQLFMIGLFPFLGIAMLLLFMEPETPRNFYAWIAKRIGRVRDELAPTINATSISTATPASANLTAFVVAYLAFQCLFPLRTLYFGGCPSWTEFGHTFSWRMMLRTKDAFMQYTFDPPEVERYLEQHPEILPKLSTSHLQRMVKNPQFILEYAHALSDTLERNGKHNVKIRCISICSLNGRPFQLMIDPTVDLATTAYGLYEVPDWILPLDRYRRAGQYPKTAQERHQAILQALQTYKREQRQRQLLQATAPEAATRR